MKIKILISLGLILFCKNIQGATYQVDAYECDMCPPGTYWADTCKNGNRQPVCLPCPADSYTESEHNNPACEICQQKEHCPRGTIFINSCSPTTNSRCECPNGEYWHIILGHDGRCYPHRICSEDQVVVKKGTPTEDTKCGPKPTQKPHTPSKGGDETTPNGQYNPDTVNYVTLPPGNGDAKAGSDRKLTVPILLIVCMAVYASYRFYKRYIPRVVHHD